MQDRIFDELNRLDLNNDGVNEKSVSTLFLEVTSEEIKMRFRKQDYYPCIAIHAVGETDGDLTWYQTLNQEEKRLIHQSRGVDVYNEAFHAADTDQDGLLLSVEELKKFYHIVYERKIAQGLPI